MWTLLVSHTKTQQSSCIWTKPSSSIAAWIDEVPFTPLVTSSCDRLKTLTLLILPISNHANTDFNSK